MPDPIIVPDHVSGEGESEMETGLFDKLFQENMAGIGQIGVLIQGNIATVSKAADYAYLQDKDMVSLTEAMGAREVASTHNPGGPSPRP